MASAMIDILLWSLFIGFSVPGFVSAFRALPSIEKLVFEGVKPWSCDICSCFWSSVIWTLVALLASGDLKTLLAAGPGYTLSLLVLRFVQAPTTFPPLADAAPEVPDDAA
jgi:hypothetical protein